jgi:hypothetical protein
MAFVVEDGTGVAGANSYLSVLEADSYHADRGNTGWSGNDQVKQQALVRATDYVEGRFGSRFSGQPKATLHFPTEGAPYPEEVPAGLKAAVAEYALRGLTKSLAPDPVVDGSGYIRVQTMEKIGPLEREFEVHNLQGAAGFQPFQPFPLADMHLRGLLRSSGRVYR